MSGPSPPSGGTSANNAKDSATQLETNGVDILDQPISIGKVRVENNVVTHTEFIVRELNAVHGSKTVSEAVDNLAAGVDSLRSLNIFRWIDAVLEEGDPAGDYPTKADVVVRLAEKPRIFLRSDLQHELRTGENTIALSGGVRNLFGRAEQLSASVAYGDQSGKTFSVNLTKPRLNGTKNKLNIGVFRQQHNLSMFSSYAEASRGLNVTISDQHDRHTFGVQEAWRDVVPQARIIKTKVDGKEIEKTVPPSASIISASVPSFKSSIFHIFKVDRRDASHVPSKGTFFKVRTELAGLGGDVNFVKLETDNKVYWPLGRYMTLGLGLNTGIVTPLSKILPGRKARPDTPEVHISDRFYMGGAMSVRGFRTFGIGPVDAADALGGDVSLGTSAELSFQFPERFKVLREINLRPHVFLNAGNLMSLSEASRSRMRDVIDSTRVSAGAGVVLPTPFGRLEINFSRPIRAQAHDELKMFQIGVGVDFL